MSRFTYVGTHNTNLLMEELIASLGEIPQLEFKMDDSEIYVTVSGAISKAEVDAVVAAHIPADKSSGEARLINEDSAVQELRDLWAQPSFQNNVKQKTQAEIRAWASSLTAAQQEAALADVLWGHRNMMLVMRDVLDALNEGG